MLSRVNELTSPFLPTLESVRQRSEFGGCRRCFEGLETTTSRSWERPPHFRLGRKSHCQPGLLLA